jgi:hypothetical protein
VGQQGRNVSATLPISSMQVLARVKRVSVNQQLIPLWWAECSGQSGYAFTSNVLVFVLMFAGCMSPGASSLHPGWTLCGRRTQRRVVLYGSGVSCSSSHSQDPVSAQQPSEVCSDRNVIPATAL